MPSNASAKLSAGVAARTIRLGGVLVASLAPILAPVTATAQQFDQYLSPYVSGSEQGRGTLVTQRPRTEYDPLGVRVGDFIIRPQLDESAGYNSNVLGTRPAVGSSLISSSPSVTVSSDFARNALGATFGVNNQPYLDQKQQSRTDVNASLGGSLDIGLDKLSVGVTEVYSHILPTDIDAPAVNKPLGYAVTDVQARYTTRFARLQFEPNVEYIAYRFDDKILPGTTTLQKVNDRDIYVGGLTTRYGDFPERSLVLVVRAIDSQYVAALNGRPRPNSMGYEALGGAQYSFSGNLQALLLAGYEIRQFSSRAFSNRSAPVAQFSLIWTPTGLTTITARAASTIEASLGETTVGVTYSRANLTIDHEYLRNVLLQGRAGISNAEYGQGVGHENLYTLGAGVSYLFNRNMRLIANYDFTARTGTSGIQATRPFTTATNLNFGDYTLHAALVTLRFSL